MTSDGLDIRTKPIFSTGEAAKMCNVSQQTIIRCFDNGELEGFLVPGSRFRRIPREALLRFMQNHSMSTSEIDDCMRILLVDDDEHLPKQLIERLGHDARFDVKTASSGFQAGMLTEQFKPQMMVVNVKVADIDVIQICRGGRRDPAIGGTKILVIVGPADGRLVQQLEKAGAYACVQEPFGVDDLAARIGDVLGVMV